MIREKIQVVGHADLVEDQNGNWWMVALGTRPIKHKHNLGRETMLTPAYWTADDWFLSRDGFIKILQFISYPLR